MGLRTLTFMKTYCLTLLLLGGGFLYAQDTLSVKEVYLDQDLAYQEDTNSLFTGIVQAKRGKQKTSYEQVYNQGVIQSEVVYYRGHREKPMFRTYYQAEKPWVFQKIYYYHKKKEKYEITSFDADGKQVLIQRYEKGKLTYSCEYDGRVKDGKEICYAENGDQTVLAFEKGEKISASCRD